ncbi:hypothetical protein J4Q44_G00259210 [Coregonus suidteri]|uniref:Uncharacterized protein n=1 Tax=Coregonus suidteri TaxID=861788 RepID=A0AAN8L278_9TELE
MKTKELSKQALHFFIGFGVLVSPLIADPFLSKTGCRVGNMTENVTEIMHHFRNTLRTSPITMHNVSVDHLPLAVRSCIKLVRGSA